MLVRRLDVVKTHNNRKPFYDSVNLFNRGLEKYCGVRLLTVEFPTSQTIIRAYGWDDWDILVTDDDDDEYRLFWKAHAVFKYVPVILFLHAVGISRCLRDDETYAQPWYACLEMAKFLCVTEIWVASQHHKSILLQSMYRLFDSDMVKEVEQKLKVMPMGIYLPTVESPRVVKLPIRICFPHRPMADKGPEFLFEYLNKLIACGVPLVLVSHRGRTKVWDQIESAVPCEFFGFVDRSSYLDILRSCDIVFSAAYHENFGFSVLEAVAVGCYPILPKRLSYLELFPIDYLYQDLDDAVMKTQRAIGNRFQSQLVEPYLWENIAHEWTDAFVAVYERFYRGTKQTPASERICKFISDAPGATKRDILKYMGWSRLTGWGRYRYQIGLYHAISEGPKPRFGGKSSQVELF